MGWATHGDGLLTPFIVKGYRDVGLDTNGSAGIEFHQTAATAAAAFATLPGKMNKSAAPGILACQTTTAAANRITSDAVLSQLVML
jgi:hypothetical protein